MGCTTRRPRAANTRHTVGGQRRGYNRERREPAAAAQAAEGTGDTGARRPAFEPPTLHTAWSAPRGPVKLCANPMGVSPVRCPPHAAAPMAPRAGPQRCNGQGSCWCCRLLIDIGLHDCRSNWLFRRTGRAKWFFLLARACLLGPRRVWAHEGATPSDPTHASAKSGLAVVGRVRWCCHARTVR